MGISERILISRITIRGLDIESLYYYIKKNPSVSRDTLMKLFGLNQKSGDAPQVNECIDYLLQLKLIKVNKTDEFKINETNYDLFELNMLNSFKKSNDPSFYQTHKLITDKNLLNIEKTELKQNVEKYLELGFTWTDEKIDFWMDMASYLGIGIKYDSSKYFLNFPKPELILNILKYFYNDNMNQIPIRNFIEKINQEFFNCYTDEHQIFKGLQISLTTLSEQNKIKLLSSSSDDPNYVIIGDKEYSYFIFLGDKK